MGFWGSAGERVRNFLRFDKEQVVVNLSKGSTNPGTSASTYDVVQDFGQDAISEHLRLDHDLMSRYMDYEDMDEFPELGCLHGDSLVFTVEHGFAKISYLAEIKEDFHVIAYDLESNDFVFATAKNARSTASNGHGKPMVRVFIEFDKEIVCTSDHLFLTVDKEWIQAGNLIPETKLMVTSQASDLVIRFHRVIRVEQVDERPEVFDLEVPGYHNFVCNGVVVHNSALDVYADDATQVESLNNKSVWVDSPDRTVQLILEDLLWKRLRIDEDIWEIARTVVKYGNSFEEILVTGDGVIGTNFLPPPTVRRIEGAQGDLRGFIQDFRGNFNYSPDEFSKLISQRMIPNGAAGGKQAALEDWEVTHFRIRSKNRRSLYGHSVLESARWIHKRLRMLEDSAIVFRLQRAQQRYAFYVDVGDMPPKETLNFIHKVRQQYKKTKFYNSSTGKLDLKFNPLPVSFDTPIPLLDGRTVTIEEMHKEHLEGKKHWVYSIDTKTKQPVPGEVSWVGKTREKAPTIRITFDDNGHADMAPDHPVMRRDGTYVKAENLLAGDSVMPLYRRQTVKKRDGLVGYEKIFNPGEGRSRFTHRLMAESINVIPKGFHVHHIDLDRKNNCPANLEILSQKDHIQRHVKDGFMASVNTEGSDYIDPERNERLRVGRGHFITKYNKSPEKRARTTALNRINNTSQHILNYNASKKHTADNAIRSRGQSAMWADPARRAVTQENMHLKFPDAFINGLRELILANPKIRAEGMVRAVNEGLVALLGSSNTRAVPQVHRHLLLKLYRKLGYADFKEFKQSCLQPNNHKVVKIEVIEARDQYCMTVEKWHNFALLLRDKNDKILNNSGILTKNSSDEDFFVPVRKGVQGSKIDVVSSPTWQCLTADTKIPLLDGSSPTIKQLAYRGETFCLYSIDKEGRTVPGRGHSARVTHEAAEIWEVSLDNNEIIRCTGNHPFLARDGSWIKAEDLKPDQSLMALHRKKMNRLNSYDTVYDAKSEQWIGVDSLLCASTLDRLPAGYLDRKVTSVRNTGKLEAVYDITVDDHHCFALEQGVFVHNSMEDINYFKEKMYAAIKVPKAYLGADAPATKGSLSQQDVRFAHTILRIQRELRNGIKKICRVHLAALGIDPSKVEFEVYMTTPSSIFELAQIEVRNAKADLAGRMSQFVSLHWILDKIFGLSEEEIEYIIKERHQEQLADAEVQSKSMGLTLDVQNSASLSQQAASANLQQQQQQQLAAAGSNAQESGDPRKHLQQSDTLAHKWPQMRRDFNYRPISNRELMEGNREHEKHVADNLDKILKSNTSLSNRLRELGHLVNELKMSMPGR